MMEVGSAGAGSITQNAPTQSGSAQQVVRAEQRVELESPAQESTPPTPSPDQRVGTLVDVTV